MSTIVVLPTYNESENLLECVTRILTAAPAVHVLVVDDDSPDGTGFLADAIAASDSRVRVLHRAQKAGLGAAYMEGFAWAMTAGYDVIVECDADGSHHPEQLHRLLTALDDHDVAIGSRWVEGGSVVDWPWRRELLSRGGSAYARAMLRLHQRDVTGGYRAFRSTALQALDLGAVTSQGYCFQIEMLWRADRAGLRIAEVPITFTERQRGVSKMRGTIVVEAMARVTWWGIRSLFAARAITVRAPEYSRA